MVISEGLNKKSQFKSSFKNNDRIEPVGQKQLENIGGLTPNDGMMVQECLHVDCFSFALILATNMCASQQMGAFNDDFHFNRKNRVVVL